MMAVDLTLRAGEPLPNDVRLYGSAGAAAQAFNALVGIITMVATVPTFAPGVRAFAPAVAVITMVATVPTFAPGGFAFAVAAAVVTMVATVPTFVRSWQYFLRWAHRRRRR